MRRVILGFLLFLGLTTQSAKTQDSSAPAVMEITPEQRGGIERHLILLENARLRIQLAQQSYVIADKDYQSFVVELYRIHGLSPADYKFSSLDKNGNPVMRFIQERKD